MYNIAFDMFTNHKTGIFRYGTSLAKFICLQLHQYPNLTINFLFNSITPYPIEKSEVSFDTWERINFVRFERPSQFLPVSSELNHWLIKRKIDLYYSPNYILDINCPINFMFTIHDLIRINYPSYSYTDDDFIRKFGKPEYEKLKRALLEMEISLGLIPQPFSFSLFFRIVNIYLAAKAKHVFTVSNTVKEELISTLQIPNNKISVISGGAREDIFYCRSKSEVNKVLNTFDIKHPYCLFIGFRHRHKRLFQLIETIKSNRNRFPKNGKIIIVGEIDDYNQDIEKDFSDFINVIGYITDEQLACLYTGAEATIITSVNEGFCLPAQESLLCGTNVISVDIPVIQEIIGQAAYFFPSEDFNKLFELIVQALNRDLKDRTVLFSKKHSWQSAANQFLETILNTI